VVLAAAAGDNNSAIARAVHLDVDSVRLWRTRWATTTVGSATERLADAPRSGAPVRITAEQVCQLVAMACEKPQVAGRPISQWSARELADEVMSRGIVPTISPRHAARLLKRGSFSRIATAIG
jgi:transposase